MPETNFFWDPVSDNILQERDAAGTVTAEYTTEPGLYGNVISQDRAAVASQFHFDALGSTLAVTDANQQATDTRAYSAFGQITESTGASSCPFQYVGQKEYYGSTTAQHYVVRVREYYPQICRWSAPDPEENDNAGWSQYVYAMNSPLGLADPSGQLVGMDTDPQTLADTAVANALQSLDSSVRAAWSIASSASLLSGCRTGICGFARIDASVSASAVFTVVLSRWHIAYCGALASFISGQVESYATTAVRKRFPRRYRHFGCVVGMACGGLSEITLAVPPVPAVVIPVPGRCGITVTISVKASAFALAGCCDTCWSSDPRLAGLPLPDPTDQSW